ncbi:MAG: homoserine dehydrogenase [Gammaproteobacteria bacterium]|nr:MAG: homoserine dehydrogenase [Gammaproteobacteria bacterium]
MDLVNIGILGLGTVGGGTAAVLSRNAEDITRRTGKTIQVTMAADKDPSKIEEFSQLGIKVVDDALAIVQDPEIDIVVELIGGYTIAKELVLEAIKKGKHVVTANKALIATSGNEIFAAAAEKNVTVAYEASVAGGIPVIKAIREGLAANKISSVAGIINGTGNFILTEMRDKGSDFADVLKQAQELGYAEADPTFDVEGIDAAHKLTILASIAFGIPLQFDKVYTQGISTVQIDDVNYAEELGYSIKHLGIAKKTETGIELRVHPTLLSKKELLANVNGVMNAVLTLGDAVGPTMYYGAGAGSEPTASAVVADIIDIARTINVTDTTSKVPALAFDINTLDSTDVKSIYNIDTAYYLRVSAMDRPGVMADITKVLGDHDISIEAMIQKEATNGDSNADIIILTTSTIESNMLDAISAIEELDTISGEVVMLRVENPDK